MSKLDILCLRLIGLLFLFIIFVSTKNVDGISIYQDENNNDGEFKHLLMPDTLILSKDMNTRSDHSSIISDYDLPYGQIHIIPFKKRTIPIELQKALYAHGIVGRRR